MLEHHRILLVVFTMALGIIVTPLLAAGSSTSRRAPADVERDRSGERAPVHGATSVQSAERAVSAGTARAFASSGGSHDRTSLR